MGKDKTQHISQFNNIINSLTDTEREKLYKFINIIKRDQYDYWWFVEQIVSLGSEIDTNKVIREIISYDILRKSTKTNFNCRCKRTY